MKLFLATLFLFLIPAISADRNGQDPTGTSETTSYVPPANPPLSPPSPPGSEPDPLAGYKIARFSVWNEVYAQSATQNDGSITGQIESHKWNDPTTTESFGSATANLIHSTVGGYSLPEKISDLPDPKDFNDRKFFSTEAYYITANHEMYSTLFGNFEKARCFIQISPTAIKNISFKGFKQTATRDNYDNIPFDEYDKTYQDASVEIAAGKTEGYLDIDPLADCSAPSPGSANQRVVQSFYYMMIGVDANRDGKITFDGRDDTTENPFRFWVNNDQDDVEYDEPVNVTESDNEDFVINSKRDLEDFTNLRLQATIPYLSYATTPPSNSYSVRLKFKSVDWGTPSIRLFRNMRYDDNKDYLKSDNAASNQITARQIGVCSNTNELEIPKEYWLSRKAYLASKDLIEEILTGDFIFEGVGKGEGNVVVAVYDKDGVYCGESAPLHLKLLDVRNMYQRAKIVNEAENIPEPTATNPGEIQSWVWDPWNWSYDDDPQAKSVTAVMVHGWRMRYMDFINWSDTAYKRLWHQGFKGKFYSFRWATYSADNNGLPGGVDDLLEPTPLPPGGTTYNKSEYRAWLCGPALASFVNSLPNPEKRHIFAHSMGNAVTGVALRNGMLVKNYALLNSAVSASAYDGTFVRLPEVTDDIETPDTNSNVLIRSSFGLRDKFNTSHIPAGVNLINFYLPQDDALKSWMKNNRYFKPDWAFGYGYSNIFSFGLYKTYQVPNEDGSGYHDEYRAVSTQPEAFGYVTKSRTGSAGAFIYSARPNGSISDTVDLRPFSFNQTHSAAWRWNSISTQAFWKRLSEKLELKKYDN